MKLATLKTGSRDGAPLIVNRALTHYVPSTGKPQTGYLRFGDTIRMEMLGRDGQSVFGAIDQQVARYPDQAA